MSTAASADFIIFIPVIKFDIVMQPFMQNCNISTFQQWGGAVIVSTAASADFIIFIPVIKL